MKIQINGKLYEPNDYVERVSLKDAIEAVQSSQGDKPETYWKYYRDSEVLLKLLSSQCFSFECKNRANSHYRSRNNGPCFLVCEEHKPLWAKEEAEEFYSLIEEIVE